MPDIEPLAASQPSRVLLAVCRIGVALLWIENSAWKRPPDFDEDAGRGLHRWTLMGVEHEVFAPWVWLVENVVLPNYVFFGWSVLAVEACLGAFLLVGLATRFWAVVGLVQTTAITLSVLYAPHEWHWSYLLMYIAHLALLATAAGRAYGVDGTLRPLWRQRGGRVSRLLLTAS